MTARSADRAWIVLHADDFGMNPAVNEGILQVFRQGLLTSTSLLANAPAAEAACAAWPKLMSEVRSRSIPTLSRRQVLGDDLKPFDLGIHLNLTQGFPLSENYPAELLGPQGQFPGIGTVFRQLRRVGTPFREAVRRELSLQIERMLDLGVQPTHLNGHQYVEMMPEVASLIPDLATRYSIRIVRVAKESSLIRTVLLRGRVASFAVALAKRYYAGRFQRQLAQTGLVAPQRFFGTSHAGLVNERILGQFLASSSPTGCTEVGLHPAVAAVDALPPAHEWHDPLASTRTDELRWLCDPAVEARFIASGRRLGRLTDLLA